MRIEGYAMIGDLRTAALVAQDGSIDWLCLPRFDSPACFASILGTRDHGRWQITPREPVTRTTRRYDGDTLVLETAMETATGAVVIRDFMPPRDGAPHLVRIVEGTRGRVAMKTELVVRFDYGSILPWVRMIDGALRAVAGPDSLRLCTPVALRGEGMTSVGDFDVAAGETVPFVLTWYESHLAEPPRIDAARALADTMRWWSAWSARCTFEGPWRPPVVRSLVTLRALADSTTGGIVAAPTTSLPEHIGGVRNWDYRMCWIRDATFTLYSLLSAGYREEALAWREWLLRAVAGKPSELQIMYGIAGERRLTEYEIPWLPGYEGSSPVRVGNAAHEQRQLDVYGELIDVLYQGEKLGFERNEFAWSLQCAVLEFLETAWSEPDEGIWEVRGPRRHFTHSKVMAWVAFDRAVKTIECLGYEGPVEQWRTKRDAIHAEVCAKGYDSRRRSFVQAYGSRDLDASLLMIPLVGFLPPTDERVRGTVAAVERDLVVDGLVRRYTSQPAVDGLPAGEGAFLACTFWLADNLALLGRIDDARAMFERLLALRNDVGLLAEEYDPRAKRMLGNFPQAFSHVSLVNSAHNLSDEGGPARHRKGA